MSEHLVLLLGILIVNFLIVICYWICSFVWRIDKKSSIVIRGIIMLLCPLVGPLFFFVGYILFKIFFSEPVDLNDVVFSKDRAETFIHADEDRERNIVPVEEAIEVTNKDELRELMMNVVRGDVQKSLASIALALNSDDTETVHYAASVLQDALNDFRSNVQKQYNLIMEGEKNRVQYAEMLVEYMDQVLVQKVFSDMEQKKYVLIMEEVAEFLFNNEKARLTSSHFESICLRLLEIEEFHLCERWCNRAAFLYPNTLSAYTCRLKLYFNCGKKQEFFKVIEELKSSAVVIDSETLELIRVFQ
ncbi:MAG: hypothetical protein J6B26_00530 [Agathobacter sp.]|nr:hypothetical protein [Agathobacter sp.]